jgi:peroxiredoxin
MTRMLRSAARATIAALCLTTASCAGGPTSGGAAHAHGGAAPDFTLPTLDGKTVHLSDFTGKNVVLLDFWSTTCDPCMMEMPHLVELYKQHKDEGLVVLAVSLDGPESRALVSSVVNDKGMVFPVLLDEETTVVARYDPKREMPFAVVIDRNGSIVHKRGGYSPGDEKTLAAEVEKALARQ